jgi:hypothetical protein
MPEKVQQTFGFSFSPFLFLTTSGKHRKSCNNAARLDIQRAFAWHTNCERLNCVIDLLRAVFPPFCCPFFVTSPWIEKTNGFLMMNVNIIIDARFKLARGKKVYDKPAYCCVSFEEETTFFLICKLE